MAKERISAMELAKMQAEARKAFRTMRVDPFIALGLPRPSDDPFARKITDNQRSILERSGVNCDRIDRMQALELIMKIDRRRSEGLASYKQVSLMIKAGLDPVKAKLAPRAVVSRMFDALKANKWNVPANWGRELDDHIAHETTS